MTSLQLIPIDAIGPNPFQPRHHANETELAELVDSILQNGLLQPLLVAPEGEAYTLVAGYRRLMASARAGLTEVPCTVREMSAEEMLRFALIENLQRSDLNPMEEAEALRRLIDLTSIDQRQAAELTNKSTGFVSERLALLKLPTEIGGLVAEAKLPIRKALEIGKLNKADSRQRLADRADRIGLDELKQLVTKKLHKELTGRKRREKSPLQRDFKEIIREMPNARIYRDRVSFSFRDEADLIDLVRKLLDELTSES